MLCCQDDEEAILRANSTKYGLGASIWSENLEKAVDTSLPDRLSHFEILSHSRFRFEMMYSNNMAPGASCNKHICKPEHLGESKLLAVVAAGPMGFQSQWILFALGHIKVLGILEFPWIFETGHVQANEIANRLKAGIGC